jgi:hypothetical protein
MLTLCFIKSLDRDGEGMEGGEGSVLKKMRFSLHLNLNFEGNRMYLREEIQSSLPSSL